MKLLQINSMFEKGSTGKICKQIDEVFLSYELGESKTIYFWGENSESSHAIKCGSKAYTKQMALTSRINGYYGFVSKKATQSAIKIIKEYNPDIVHLHNIHDHTVNLNLLFTFLKDSKAKIVWTFHDCWAFTAYCAHFTFAKCDKWKTGCHNCPQRRRMSWFFDRSEELYLQKKELFKNLDLTIVTPSNWMADLVSQSFLGDYPIKVIHNGIDLSLFKPTKSSFRNEYKISSEQFIILGVAFEWNERKGVDVFVELSKRLNPLKYKIVLVGTNEKIDKTLPSSIISIHCTQNQMELAQIYTAADIFVNPTREDTFPTVNLEALACGTPIVTFDTGGSPESIDEKSGIVVPINNVDAVERVIIKMTEEHICKTEDCLKRAEQFDYHRRFHDYSSLYEELCGKN